MCIFLFFLGLGLVMLAVSVRGYKEYSQRDIRALEHQGRSANQVSIQDLRAMFEYHGSSGADYRIISQKNLFSPDRQAWEPPPDKGEAKETVARGPKVDSGSFRLYGVTTTQNKKMALIYCQMLAGGNKHRLAGEGEKIHDPDDGSVIYEVLHIDQESVTLQSGSEIFEVSLYGHDRQIAETAGQNGLSIVVGGTTEPIEVASKERTRDEPSPERESSDQDPAEEVEPSEPKGEQPPSAPVESRLDRSDEGGDEASRPGLAELLQKMREGRAQDSTSNVEDMESRVEDGSMRRVDTPFGPVYRPVK